MSELTDLQLIQKYVECRNLVAVKKEAFEKIVEPYQHAMSVIETALLARLIKRGADNTKTDAGTAYKVEALSCKVTNRDEFLRYVANGGEGMLIASAQKDAVRDYIAEHNSPPPGVEISYFTKVNVRKS